MTARIAKSTGAPVRLHQSHPVVKLPMAATAILTVGHRVGCLRSDRDCLPIFPIRLESFSNFNEGVKGGPGGIHEFGSDAESEFPVH